MLTAAAGAIRLALWEREAPWGQLGVPRSLCELQIHDDATNCRRKKIQVGPAPYWTLPAMVTPKIRGSYLRGKPSSRPLLPHTLTQASTQWSGLSQPDPSCSESPPLPGPAGSEEAQSAQDVLSRGQRAGAWFPGLWQQEQLSPLLPPHPGPASLLHSSLRTLGLAPRCPCFPSRLFFTLGIRP